MKGCKGLCDRLESKRPFGDPYPTHTLCRRCDAWIDRVFLIEDKCPCCKFKPRTIGRRKHVEERYDMLSERFI